MDNFTPSQPVIDFLVSADETGMKNAVSGIAPADLVDPANKPLSHYTIYGEVDGTTKVLDIVGSIAQYIVPVNVTCLSLGNGVTDIGSSAFSGCSYLTGSIIIPNSVINIGDNAFNACFGLTGDLVIPNSVTSIGVAAFYSCIGFTGSLTIPDSVTSIGGYAFSGCSSITRIESLATNAPSIGSNAFYGMTSVVPAEIHVPVGSTGYAESYDGLTVVYDL